MLTVSFCIAPKRTNERQPGWNQERSCTYQLIGLYSNKSYELDLANSVMVCGFIGMSHRNMQIQEIGS